MRMFGLQGKSQYCKDSAALVALKHDFPSNAGLKGAYVCIAHFLSSALPLLCSRLFFTPCLLLGPDDLEPHSSLRLPSQFQGTKLR